MSYLACPWRRRRHKILEGWVLLHRHMFVFPFSIIKHLDSQDFTKNIWRLVACRWNGVFHDYHRFPYVFRYVHHRRQCEHSCAFSWPMPSNAHQCLTNAPQMWSPMPFQCLPSARHVRNTFSDVCNICGLVRACLHNPRCNSLLCACFSHTHVCMCAAVDTGGRGSYA